MVLNYCVPPEYNDKALELLASGAKKAGRNFEEIDRPQLIVCSVDEDHDVAIDHTKGLLEANITVQTCWDADRLDLGRVGIVPDPARLCTAAAREPTMREWAYERSLRTDGCGELLRAWGAQ